MAQVIVEPVKTPRTDSTQEVERFFRIVAQRLSYISNDGNPTGAVIPRWIGDRCFDSTNTEWYVSTGTTAADWEITT